MIDFEIVEDCEPYGSDVDVSSMFYRTIFAPSEELIKLLDVDCIDIALVKREQLAEVKKVMTPNSLIIVMYGEDFTEAHHKHKDAYKNNGRLTFNFTMCHLFEFGIGMGSEYYYANFFSSGMINKHKIDSSDSVNKEMTMINIINSFGDEESNILITDQRFVNLFYYLRITGKKVIMPIESQEEFYSIVNKMEAGNVKEEKNVYSQTPTLF